MLSLLGMNGLSRRRAIESRTLCSTSEKVSVDHWGRSPGRLLEPFGELLVGEGRHAAVGVVEQDDLLGAEPMLGDRERADGVVGEHTSGVAEDVGLALVQPQHPRWDEARVHARQHGDPLRGCLLEIGFLKALRIGARVLQHPIGLAHRGAILSAPSRRIVSPFSIRFSTMWQASVAYSSGRPRRLGNGIWAPSSARASWGRAASSGVSNKPGAMVITRTPRLARSRAAGSVRLTMPPLDAA